MKKYIFFLVLIITGIQVKAQQYPLVSQYMYNKLLYNPAYAGINEEFTASMVQRLQWTGMEGAPSSTILLGDVPFNEKIGLGGVLYYDQIGANKQIEFNANVSYSIGAFSMGLKAGFSNYSWNPASLDMQDEGDHVFMNDVRSGFIPKFGFGAYYDNLDYYIGVSVPDLVKFDLNDVLSGDNEEAGILPRNIIAMGGFNYFINDRITLIPSTMVKIFPTGPWLVDINLNAKLLEKFLAGAGYRLNNAASIMFQVPFLDKFKAGYAFEWYFGKVNMPSYGTHEIMISYGFQTF